MMTRVPKGYSRGPATVIPATGGRPLAASPLELVGQHFAQRQYALTIAFVSFSCGDAQSNMLCCNKIPRTSNVDVVLIANNFEICAT